MKVKAALKEQAKASWCQYCFFWQLNCGTYCISYSGRRGDSRGDTGKQI